MTHHKVGWDIVLGIDKPKNLSFNDLKCEKNRRLFDNSANGFPYGFSYDSLHDHCVKIARIRSYSGLYFPAVGLNMERYSFHFS